MFSDEELNQQKPLPQEPLPEEGILEAPEHSGANAEETRSMREYHNANHALWYFTMIVYASVNQKTAQSNAQKSERVLAHLTHLKEFLRPEDRKHRIMIEQIYHDLLIEHPENHHQWVRFIYMHWNLLCKMAAHYGHQDRCFPESDFIKIRDLVQGMHGFKWWWWDLKLKRWHRAAQVFLKKISNKAFKANS